MLGLSALSGLFRRTLTVSEMSGDDLSRAAEIHAEGFSHAWDDGTIAGMLSGKGMRALAVRPASGRDRSIGAFLIYRMSADEAEIITIATAKSMRRQGAAALLMDELVRRCLAERMAWIFLEVDAVNTAALGLYRRLGFREVGRRKGYYQGTASDGAGQPRDALVMRLDLKA